MSSKDSCTKTFSYPAISISSRVPEVRVQEATDFVGCVRNRQTFIGEGQDTGSINDVECQNI